MQFTMKWITVWNGHTQLMFAFSDLGRPSVLSFSERLVEIRTWYLVPDYKLEIKRIMHKSCFSVFHLECLVWFGLNAINTAMFFFISLWILFNLQGETLPGFNRIPYLCMIGRGFSRDHNANVTLAECMMKRIMFVGKIDDGWTACVLISSRSTWSLQNFPLE